MRALSAYDIVQLWEWGRDKHPVDRGLALLARAHPELTLDQLQSLTVGQRNSRLLTLRELTLGPALKGYARCEECGAALEFSVPVAAVRLPEPDARERSVEAAGVALRFRPLDSRDLAAIAGLRDLAVARLRLIERCLLHAEQDGRPLAPAELPDLALAALIEALDECDPQAEPRFRLTCASCGHGWSALFDIVAFFWIELSARAERLLADVHVLARAYGWREADILALSEARRHFYLGMVG